MLSCHHSGFAGVETVMKTSAYGKNFVGGG